jgi:uncharacterized coiled-coil DUF342 family protein
MHALLAPFVLAVSLAAAPAQTAPAQQPEKKAKKVWTNDDLDSLRGGPRGVSVASSAGATAATEETGASKEKPAQTEDPAKKYREKLVPLRAQLDQIDAQIKEVRGQLSNPFKGTNAVDLQHPSATMRPEDVLKNLEQKRREIQQQIDDLEEAARRSGISPGDIR